MYRPQVSRPTVTDVMSPGPTPTTLKVSKHYCECEAGEMRLELDMIQIAHESRKPSKEYVVRKFIHNRIMLSINRLFGYFIWKKGEEPTI